MHREPGRDGGHWRTPLRTALAIAIAIAIVAAVASVTTGNPDPSASAADATTAQNEPITGTLSRPAYTVISLAPSGEAATDVAASDGTFSLTPPAETTSLHLRAPDGTYAGPVVLEPARNFELEAARKAATGAQAEADQAKQMAKQAKRKLKKAKKKVKRAKKKVKRAKKKVRKASGKKAKRKAKKKLKRAKKKLKKAKRKKRKAKKQRKAANEALDQANQSLAEANSRLELAERRDATGSQRATTGIRAGATLGPVEVDPAGGYAKASGLSEELWTTYVDTGYEVQATGGVPIGAGNFGRVRSAQLNGSAVGDLDRDGVSDQLDIDDDGDLVLDNIDETPQGRSARTSAQPRAVSAGEFGVKSILFGVQTANANAGSTDEEISGELQREGRMVINILPGDTAELDCGGAQGSADPGLVYCTTGGTGSIPGPGDPPYPSFPECCDDDGDGFGTLTHDPGSPPQWPLMWLAPGAASDQIGSGDVLIQRVMSDGVESEFVSALRFVFVTSPALASYDDGQGNSATVPYPRGYGVPGSKQDPFPVEAGPDGDVKVALAFWRPQRRPIPPETGEWIDMGGLDHNAALFGLDTGEFTCEAGAYSTEDPNLTPVEPLGGTLAGGFRDLAVDQPADPDNTFTYTLNLSECLESKGMSFSPGEPHGFLFSAYTPRSSEGDDPDNANDSAFFELK